MEFIKKFIIGAVVVILVAFTLLFVIDAYNTGKIGDKAGKVETDFTEQIMGTWTGDYSISQITFEAEGKAKLTMLGVVVDGEYADSYDINTDKHTLKIKYITSVGLSVERFYDAVLIDDKLVLTDTQFETVKLSYKRSENSGSSQNNSGSTTIYNPGISVYSKELLGSWVSTSSANSGFEFKENGEVYVKLLSIGYDGKYTVSIDETNNRCILKINYISIGNVTISNSYYVTIEDTLLTLTQIGAENIETTYTKS